MANEVKEHLPYSISRFSGFYRKGFSHKLLRDHPLIVYVPYNVGNFFFRETYGEVLGIRVGATSVQVFRLLAFFYVFSLQQCSVVRVGALWRA